MKQITIVLLATLAFCAPATFAEMAVINLDFGLGEAYVGDDGVFSSPGGTYWNKIDAIEWNYESLLNEFGNPTVEGDVQLYLPWFGNQSNPVFLDQTLSSTGGPLKDGYRFDTGSLLDTAVGIRPFEGPVDVVVYFFDTGRINTVTFGSGHDDYYNDTVTTLGGYPPLFPGAENRVYLQYNGLEPQITTLGSPALAGVYVAGTDHGGIAAMQIRGNVIAPEPSSLAMLGLGGLLVSRRRRS